jgi:hypothetical protein
MLGHAQSKEWETRKPESERERMTGGKTERRLERLTKVVNHNANLAFHTFILALLVVS